MIKIVIIGAGNVALHLYNAFSENEKTNVTQVYNRNIYAVNFIDPAVTQVTDQFSELKEADIYIICVKDDAVANISGKLPFKNKLVVHTSGSIPIDSLIDTNRRGVFYPLQTFSKGKKVDFYTIPICIEAENIEDLKYIETLAKSISGNVYEVNSDQRKSLHLAAVFVNNFVNHMYHIGNEICKENNITFKILQPLIKETAEKIINLDPVEAQTGPAKRNDLQTIEMHTAQLKNKKYNEIYKLLTKSIQETYGRKEL